MLPIPLPEDLDSPASPGPRRPDSVPSYLEHVFEHATIILPGVVVILVLHRFDISLGEIAVDALVVYALTILAKTRFRPGSPASG
jgi:hypothetical protein